MFLKIDVRDDNLIVFLNNRNIENIDFYNTRELEKYFRELFLKFNDEYGFDLSGSYNIDVYIDDKYGIILDIKPIDEAYYDCDYVDMNITISKYKGFLYRIEGFVDIDCNVYFYEHSFYYEPLDVSFFDIGRVFENCEIVYGKEVYDIINYGSLLSNRLVIDKIL